MKLNLKKIIIGVLLIIGIFPQHYVFSEEEKDATISNFSYDIVYPEDQKDKTLGYFDIVAQSKEKQVLSILLHNSGDKPLPVNIRITSAKTDSNGRIEYGYSTNESDPSLTADLAQLTDYPKVVNIPANGQQQVDISLDLSTTEMNGLLLGGIQLTPILSEENTGEDKNQGVIENEFAFIIGVMVRLGNYNESLPNLKLNSLVTAFREGKSTLYINISNDRAALVEEMDIAVNVTKAGKTKSLFDYKKEDMRMAPNSSINFPVLLADKHLNMGSYDAFIEVTTKGGKHWEWKETFKLTDYDLDKRNDYTVAKNPTILFWLVPITGLIGLLGIYVIKRKKDQKEQRSGTMK